MRMKTVNAIRAVLQTVDRVLSANLPVGKIWLSSSAPNTHRDWR